MIYCIIYQSDRLTPLPVGLLVAMVPDLRNYSGEYNRITIRNDGQNYSTKTQIVTNQNNLLICCPVSHFIWSCVCVQLRNVNHSLALSTLFTNARGKFLAL